MKDQLQYLTRLQEIDEQIDSHERDLARLPQEVQEIARNLVTLRREISEHKERLAEIEKDLRAKERDLETEQDKIKRSERRLLGIKNQKEYNALSRQVKLGKKVAGEIEDAVLAFMTEMESIRKTLEKKEKDYAAYEQGLHEKKAEEEKVTKAAQAALEALGAERAAVAEFVDRDYIKKYQTVRKVLGKALAEINNGSCSECNMAVPPQLNIRILKQEEIISCPNCQRILYVKPENIPAFNKIDQ
ncbi:MAG: C4-type zinc ribbon domain-containing protein [Desulfomonile sp.]|nr:C4-type zinc ribbon domain-containing protein [Desulfomonile sp.]